MIYKVKMISKLETIQQNLNKRYSLNERQFQNAKHETIENINKHEVGQTNIKKYRSRPRPNCFFVKH